jgi:hypothetical protein
MKVGNQYNSFHSDKCACVIAIMEKKKEQKDRNTLNKSISLHF